MSCYSFFFAVAFFLIEVHFILIKSSISFFVHFNLKLTMTALHIHWVCSTFATKELNVKLFEVQKSHLNSVM